MTDAKLPQETRVPESEQTQALERFFVIRPFLEDGIPLAQIARERTIPLRTLSRWVKQYREVGLAGLSRQGRADKGEQRGVAPDLKLLVEGLALQKPRRSGATIHRQVTRVATEQGWTAPVIVRSLRSLMRLTLAWLFLPRRLFSWLWGTSCAANSFDSSSSDLRDHSKMGARNAVYPRF